MAGNLISAHELRISASFLLAAKLGLIALLCVAPEPSRGEMQMLGHVTPPLLAPRGVTSGRAAAREEAGLLQPGCLEAA